MCATCAIGQRAEFCIQINFEDEKYFEDRIKLLVVKKYINIFIAIQYETHS